jgi:hypothetical protein
MRLGHCLTAILLPWVFGCGPSGVTSLSFVSITPATPQINEDTVVVFSAKDYRGVALAGENVSFALLSPFTDGGVAGVTLNPPSSVTDKNGNVQTTVVASARISSVIVVARDGSLTSLSPPISFAGAIPSARNFTFQCGEFAGAASGGLHTLRVYDEARFITAGIKLNCSAHAGDRNGDGLPGVTVSFLTEAGTIAPSQTSISDVDGNATILYKTSFPLPKDVDPGVFSWNPTNDLTHTGDYIAPLWMRPYEWVKDPINNFAAQFPGGDNRTEPQRPDPVRPGIINNRRDNLVAMIAVTTGEEQFDDLNGNGKWDQGEPFVDTTEPFVDSNDNGTWDPGELFIDTNGNGQWDGKNGKYDPSTLIWASEKILWTGVPTIADYNPPQPVVLIETPVTGLAVPHCGDVGPVNFLYTDPWYNVMTQDSSGDGCTVNISPQVIQPEPSIFGQTGLWYTYPSVVAASFYVFDGHQCDVNPPPPPFPQPAPWIVNVVCNSTSSPLSGDLLAYPVFTMTGTVL